MEHYEVNLLKATFWENMYKYNLSPKDGQESLEGSGGIKLSKMCNNGGEREQKVHQEALEPLGKKGPLKGCPGNLAVGHRIPQERKYRPEGRYYRPM